MEAARKGLGEGANGPAEHTCNASGHCTGLWDNTMVYGHGSRRVVGTSPQLTCCGGIRVHAAAAAAVSVPAAAAIAAAAARDAAASLSAAD